MRPSRFKKWPGDPGGGLGEVIRQPGSLVGQLHTAFLPLISTFQRASAAAGALDSLAVAIADHTDFQNGSLEEHLRTLLHKQVKQFGTRMCSPCRLVFAML